MARSWKSTAIPAWSPSFRRRCWRRKAALPELFFLTSCRRRRTVAWFAKIISKICDLRARALLFRAGQHPHCCQFLTRAPRTAGPAVSPSAGYRSCMLQHGWRYSFMTRSRIQPTRTPADPYFSTNARVAPGHFIDHDNGMDCQNMGGAEVCDPPNGTVRYFDPIRTCPARAPARRRSVRTCNDLRHRRSQKRPLASCRPR